MPTLIDLEYAFVRFETLPATEEGRAHRLAQPGDVLRWQMGWSDNADLVPGWDAADLRLSIIDASDNVVWTEPEGTPSVVYIDREYNRVGFELTWPALSAGCYRLRIVAPTYGANLFTGATGSFEYDDPATSVSVSGGTWLGRSIDRWREGAHSGKVLVPSILGSNLHTAYGNGTFEGISATVLLPLYVGWGHNAPIAPPVSIPIYLVDTQGFDSLQSAEVYLPTDTVRVSFRNVMGAVGPLDSYRVKFAAKAAPGYSLRFVWGHGDIGSNDWWAWTERGSIDLGVSNGDWTTHSVKMDLKFFSSGQRATFNFFVEVVKQPGAPASNLYLDNVSIQQISTLALFTTVRATCPTPLVSGKSYIARASLYLAPDGLTVTPNVAAGIDHQGSYYPGAPMDTPQTGQWTDYVFSFTAAANGTAVVQFQIPRLNELDGYAYIDRLYIQEQLAPAAPVDSECFDLAERHDETAVLGFAGYDLNFDFTYPTEAPFFEQQLRVRAQLIDPTPKDEIETDETSAGDKRVLYAKLDREYTLEVPYMTPLDVFALMGALMHDAVKIDGRGVRYVGGQSFEYPAKGFQKGKGKIKLLDNPKLAENTAGGVGPPPPDGGSVTRAEFAQAVADLQAQLAGKAPLEHSHVIAEVVGLQGALDGKAPVSHSHTIAQVTGLQSALDGKAAAAHTHAIGEVAGLQTMLDELDATDASLQAQINSLPPPTDTAIQYTPADQNNLAGTWQGLISSTKVVLRSALDRIASIVQYGRIWIPRAQDAGGVATGTPSAASENKLENLFDSLHWRGRPLLSLPANPSITAWTDASGVVIYGKLQLAVMQNLSPRTVIGNGTNSGAAPGQIQATAARQVMASNSGNTGIGFRALELPDLPNAPSDTVLGNVSGTTAARVDLPMVNLINSRNAAAITYLGLEKTFRTDIYCALAALQVADTTSEQTLLPSGTNRIGSRTIPGLLITPAPGASFLLRLAGRLISPASASTMRIRVKLGSLVIADSGAVTLQNSLNNLFTCNIGITARAVSGTDGTFAQGILTYGTPSGQQYVVEIPNVAGTNPDWTVSQQIEVTVQFGAGAHTITVNQAEISCSMQ